MRTEVFVKFDGQIYFRGPIKPTRSHVETRRIAPRPRNEPFVVLASDGVWYVPRDSEEIHIRERPRGPEKVKEKGRDKSWKNSRTTRWR